MMRRRRISDSDLLRKQPHGCIFGEKTTKAS